MDISRRDLIAAGLAVGSQFLSGPAVADTAPLTLTLIHPDGRNTAYRVLCPSRPGRWGLVLFSHGANSSNHDYDRLWGSWADAGYLVIGPNHIDTGPPATQLKVSRSALWQARLDDTILPLRQQATFNDWAASRGASLDWTKVCAAGHSFGAVVAQALAGARIAAAGEAEPRSTPMAAIAACIALSPPGPLKGFIPDDAWSTVAVPSFLQTGDADILPGFVDDWRLRLTGFAGPPNRWTLIGHGVNHYFHGLICRLTPGATADLAALQETAQLSSRFLDAYLRGNADDLNALQSRARRGDDGVAIFQQG
jgi:pimeloyl-ACP methyl ester carboxylesterase